MWFNVTAICGPSENDWHFCSITESNDSGSASAKKEKEKKNRKKDKENGSGGGEAGNHGEFDAPEAVVSRLHLQCPQRH